MWYTSQVPTIPRTLADARSRAPSCHEITVEDKGGLVATSALVGQLGARMGAQLAFSCSKVQTGTDDGNQRSKAMDSKYNAFAPPRGP